MRYVARRFIDFFRPGQEVPADAYDADTLAQLVEKGHVEAVEVEVSEPPKAKPATRKRKTTAKAE